MFYPIFKFFLNFIIQIDSKFYGITYLQKVLKILLTPSTAWVADLWKKETQC